jgi:hypothetical protein
LLAAASVAVVSCGGGGGSAPASSAPPATYTIEGTVTGLSGYGLVLQDNGGDNLTVAGSAFTFSTPIQTGDAYDVTVLTQPSNPTQTCSLTRGSGTVTNANVMDVGVTCTTAAGSGNLAPVVVDSGPSGLAANTSEVNTLFVTVTLCAPGSATNCQNVDHVEVDTASFGLRILASVLNASLLSALPQVKETTSGNPLTECVQFADGYSWGSIRTATVNIAAETAASTEIQLIGDTTYSVPSTCGAGMTQEDTVASFGAKGMLGIGPLVHDCGASCVTNAANGVYYNCPTDSTCAESTVSLAQQVSNPIFSFTTDNNGAILELPALTNDTAATVAGSLYFGIGTEGNNALGGQTVLTTTASTATTQGSQTVTTAFNGATLTRSYLDSGSNGLFFPDTTPPIAPCTHNAGFYCPASTLAFTGATGATIGGLTGSEAVEFSIGNADTLNSTYPNNAAFDDIGGPSAGNNTFDWGLPFFFGRRVYIAIEGTAPTGGPAGPYYAF